MQYTIHITTSAHYNTTQGTLSRGTHIRLEDIMCALTCALTHLIPDGTAQYTRHGLGRCPNRRPVPLGVPY